MSEENSRHYNNVFRMELGKLVKSKFDSDHQLTKEEALEVIQEARKIADEKMSAK